MKLPIKCWGLSKDDTYFALTYMDKRNRNKKYVAINIRRAPKDYIFNHDVVHFDNIRFFHDFKLQDLFKVIPHYHKLTDDRKELLRLAIIQCIKNKDY